MPHGTEQAAQARMVWDQWLKQQMPQAHHAQEIAERMANRKHPMHPATTEPDKLQDDYCLSMSAAAATS
eukprot:3267428-Karenia_brevis.AAC.1